MDIIKQLKKPLFELQLFEGIVINRPSKKIKSPYLADVLINGENILCHTPSLGCCGLVSTDKKVLMTKKNSKNSKSKYSIDFVYDKQTIVGVNPLYANKIVECCLNNNYIYQLRDLKNIKREYSIDESRLDFYGEKDNKKYYIEVKNVPLADYVDVDKKERKNYTKEINNANFDKKIAYFPDGFRKKAKDVISPRALKHIQELELLAKTKNIRAILCFIIQRGDTHIFQTSHIDPIYREAVYSAWKNGVEIKTIQVEWTKEGTCNFLRNDMPILLCDTYGPHYVKKLKKLKRLNLSVSSPKIQTV